jgi:hypothetical protein
MKRTALVICLAAIMLLALAAPAFATDASSGTVYGKAVLAPYAIVVSGGGTDPGNPLTYQGNLGQWAPEMYGSEVWVQNVGTQNAQISISANQLPTDGISTWGLSAYGSAENIASWTFFGPSDEAAVLEQSNPNYYSFSTLDNNLSAGASTWFESEFRFPTFTGSTGDHNMSATISVADPI